jgi:diketogulonate reductase-like aldo/keto reductase
MATPDTLRYTRIPLADGSGAIPALGFGTLIPDPLATIQATKTALEVGFRHFDCAERYRNEQAVGDAMQEVIKAGTIQRKDIFVTTKLWNNNHRPDRVKPAFEASRRDSSSTTLIATSSIPPLPSSRATSKTRGTSAAR